MDSMTLEQASYIGELIAVIAVISSLIYVALQVRQNTQAIHLSASQTTHDALSEAYMVAATNAELNGILRRGTDDFTALSDDEAGQFFAFWSATLYMTQNWYYQWRNGALEQDLFMSWMSGLTGAMNLPGFQHFWSHRKHLFTPALQDYVEQEVFGKGRPGHRALGTTR